MTIIHALVLYPVLLAGPGLPGAAADPAACPPAGMSRETLIKLKQDKFAMADGAARNQLALALTDCAGDPDPVIRDGVAYEGLATWLRGKQLDSTTVVGLYQRLTASMQAPPDPDGFRRPFAVLMLSEVARADRINPTLSAAQLDTLLNEAAGYLRGVDDYRGFVDGQGWRHGVAHASDLVLQLALNPRLDSAQATVLMTAVASRIAPPGKTAYIHGEPERLARAVYFTCRRRLMGDAWWERWLNEVSSPDPLASWADAYQSESGLAQRQNTLGFLYALHYTALSARDAQGDAIARMASSSIDRILGA